MLWISYTTEPELNIRTYSKWFAVLDALELDKNVLCTVAVTQMVSYFHYNFVQI